MSMAEEVIMLVGGFGTRLQTVVPGVPKPLASVAGRPFLAWLLDAYAAAGMRRAILATGYRAEQVREFAGARWNDMEIAYSHEEEPLGTGGAVRQASSLVSGDGVHLINGDTFLRYSPVDLEKACRDAGTMAGVALAEVDEVSRYGAVEIVAGRVSLFSEKGGQGPGLINAGCYFLTVEALSCLPKRAAFSLETGFLHAQAEARQLTAFTATSGFIDIGVPEDYARAQELFA